MSVIKRRDNDTNNLQLFRNQFDDLIDNFFPNSFLDFPRNDILETSFKPKINISEDEDSYYVEAELPGVSKEDIELQYIDETLKIKAEKRDHVEDKKKNYHRFESFFGTFQRSIHLPNVIEDGKIEADFKNGLLCINLPKSKNKKSDIKKINIR